jgi:hypothetical protein
VNGISERGHALLFGNHRISTYFVDIDTFEQVAV